MPMSLDEIKNKILNQDSNSNLSVNYGNYVNPNTIVEPQWSDSTNGWVDFEKPNVINIANMRQSTLGHEATHVQQNNANLHDIFQPQNRDTASGYANQGRQGLTQVLQQLREKYPNKVGANLGDSSREILANLQGIESSLPAGTNILDTLNLPPAYRRLLEHRMFAGKDKFFESDYTGNRKPLQNSESIYQYIKRKYF